MNRMLPAAAFVLMAVSSAPADAANLREFPSWYWGVSGGLTYMTDADISGTGAGKIDYNDGVIGTFVVGYTPDTTMQPFNSMRFEMEAGYHHNTVNTYTPSGGAAVKSPAGTRAISYMGNAYYDFHNSSSYTPYVGAGAGGATVKLGRTSGAGNTDGVDNVLAYQFMAGFYYTPPGIPTTQWNLGYRYFVEDSPEFGAGTGKVKINDNTSHNFELGARFRF